MMLPFCHKMYFEFQSGKKCLRTDIISMLSTSESVVQS